MASNLYAILFFSLCIFTTQIFSLDLILTSNNNNNSNNNDNNTHTTIWLPSRYTTLGGGPAHTLKTNLSFINRTNIKPNCELTRMNVSELIGNIVVYVDSDIPLLYKCCSDRNGNTAAFARMLQRYGASGVIIGESQKVYLFICFCFY